MRAAAGVLAAIGLWAAPAAFAAEVTVLSAGALRGALSEVASVWERRTGNPA